MIKKIKNFNYNIVSLALFYDFNNNNKTHAPWWND